MKNHTTLALSQTQLMDLIIYFVSNSNSFFCSNFLLSIFSKFFSVIIRASFATFYFLELDAKDGATVWCSLVFLFTFESYLCNSASFPSQTHTWVHRYMQHFGARQFFNSLLKEVFVQ